MPKVPLGTTVYCYDRADRTTSVGTTSYTVNADGNLVARGSDSFGYDQANRLKSASVGGTSSTYVYDGDGKRTSKTVGGTQTSYTYDVNASLPVLLDDGTHKYVWGLGLAFAVDNSGNPLVYHTDGLGSVRALGDGSGNVVQTYEYDEYGNVVSSSGTITQPFQFTGEQSDLETGFSYLRARYYDPGSGRFTSRDLDSGDAARPISLGRFAYVLDNPAVGRDPSGLLTIAVCFNGEYGAPGVMGVGSVCVAVASNGDVGFTESIGGGGTTGFLREVSGGVQVTNGNSLNDLRGPFTGVGGSVALGPGFGADVFQSAPTRRVR